MISFIDPFLFTEKPNLKIYILIILTKHTNHEIKSIKKREIHLIFANKNQLPD